MKTQKIVYWIATGLLCALMLISAGVYIIHNHEVSEIFTHLGYPTYVIYPLAFAKILGVIAITTKKSRTLKEWAYAGFFYDFVLAFTAHFNAGESVLISGFAIGLLAVSYFVGKRLFD
jgi:DoxX-like family